jgi:hypothetical protein
VVHHDLAARPLEDADDGGCHPVRVHRHRRSLHPLTGAITGVVEQRGVDRTG